MTCCSTCSDLFAAKRSDALFCSPRCRKIASRRRATAEQKATVALCSRRVTDNGVTLVTDNARGAVTDNFDADLDALAARIERGETLTSAEIAAGTALCEREFTDDEDQWLADRLLARLDLLKEASETH